MFKELSSDVDLECAMIDKTIVKVHRAGQGAKGGLFTKTTGRSRGSITTTIPDSTDVPGNLIDVCLRPGQAHELREPRTFRSASAACLSGIYWQIVLSMQIDCDMTC
jgi:hypothetical protein